MNTVSSTPEVIPPVKRGRGRPRKYPIPTAQAPAPIIPEVIPPAELIPAPAREPKRRKDGGVDRRSFNPGAGVTPENWEKIRIGAVDRNVVAHAVATNRGIRLRRAMLRFITIVDVQALTRKLIDMGLAGDRQAIRDILEFAVGKPSQAVEVNVGGDGVDIRLSVESLLGVHRDGPASTGVQVQALPEIRQEG
jgi:hypothetical protein